MFPQAHIHTNNNYSYINTIRDFYNMFTDVSSSACAHRTLTFWLNLSSIMSDRAHKRTDGLTERTTASKTGEHFSFLMFTNLKAFCYNYLHTAKQIRKHTSGRTSGQSDCHLFNVHKFLPYAVIYIYICI